MSQTIFDALRESHERQRALCTRLTRTSAAKADLRRDLLRELHLELGAHAAAEERFLYAVILMEDAGLNSARHALSEHHEIDKAVEKLQGLEPAGTAWAEQAKAVSHTVRHHLKEEETKFFQVAGKCLTEAAKLRLAGRYERDYRRMHRKLSAQ